MTARDAASVEREYNLRAAFPDHSQWFTRWAADSARARASRRVLCDVRYGHGLKQTMDLFPAENPRAALLFIHGGYWRALDKSEHSFIAPAFVDAGIGVAVVNYDLCPAVGIGTIAEQCREAVDWLLQNGRKHGFLAQPLIVAGHSAGGHLTSMMFATDWKARRSQFDTPSGPIAGGISISGIFDLTPLVDVSFNADLRLDYGTALALSPIREQPRVDSPLLLAAGAGETPAFIDQSRRLWDCWPGCRTASSGGPLFVQGKHHFSVLTDLADSNSELHAKAIELFP